MDNQDYVIDRARNMAWPNADEAMHWYRARLDELEGWRPIAEAPRDGRDVELYAGKITPRYIGRFRYGDLGEPSPELKAWRCSSSGRIAHPTHFKPLGPDPET